MESGGGGGGCEGGRKDGLKQFFSTVQLLVNKLQKDVWAVSHLYNQTGHLRPTPIELHPVLPTACESDVLALSLTVLYKITIDCFCFLFQYLSYEWSCALLPYLLVVCSYCIIE